jgi:CHAT domain-containing protein
MHASPLAGCWKPMDLAVRVWWCSRPARRGSTTSTTTPMSSSACPALSRLSARRGCSAPCGRCQMWQPLLIAKFYELHMGLGVAPPTALWRAQLWLRQATNVELEAYTRLAAEQGRLECRHVAAIERDLGEEGLTRSRNSALIEWIEPEAAQAGGNEMAGTKRLAQVHQGEWTPTPLSATPSLARLGERARGGSEGNGPSPDPMINLQNLTHTTRPYAHPYFWGGFIHTGL